MSYTEKDVTGRITAGECLQVDPSLEDPAFDAMLARVQAVPCYRDLTIQQQKDWVQAKLEAAQFRRLLDLENSTNAS